MAHMVVMQDDGALDLKAITKHIFFFFFFMLNNFLLHLFLPSG